MCRIVRVVVLVALGLTVAGCKSREFDGPTVDAFNGRVVRDGEPVSFPEGEQVTLQVSLHEKAQSFGIPLKSDGSFQITWMPIGKYSMMLERPPKGGKGPPTKYQVPGELVIEPGKTEYTIELGKGWNP
jgi:hypothetical protein